MKRLASLSSLVSAAATLPHSPACADADAESAVPAAVVDVSQTEVGSWSLAFANEVGVCYGSLDIEA